MLILDIEDTQRSPPRGPATHLRKDRHNNHHEHEYERSRSPRRDGRGRYTDRDQEGYESPRDRSRSRSPYFGAPPNRTVILEGLPLSMTQEDVRNPIPKFLRLISTNPTIIFYS